MMIERVPARGFGKRIRIETCIDLLVPGIIHDLEDNAMTSPLVNDLFRNFEKAYAALDVERYADYFADSFISAGPRGAIANSRDEFMNLARQAASFYRRIGLSSAKMLPLEETAISGEYSLVYVQWGVTFRKTGDRLFEFDVSYIVQKTGTEPRIVMFITHQDEQEAMRTLGIAEEAAKA